jgi:hypothetical protein
MEFLKLVVVRSFCFGLILSPPLAWIAKNGIIRALEALSSPLVRNKWVKIIPKTKSFCFLPQRWRVSWSDGEGWVTEWKPLSSPKTPIPFQYTYDLVWKRLEKHISHSIWKRHDQRYIYKSNVCSLTKEIAWIKNIELMPKFGKGLFIKWLGKDIG